VRFEENSGLAAVTPVDYILQAIETFRQQRDFRKESAIRLSTSTCD
jgi:hypothetical protein